VKASKEAGQVSPLQSAVEYLKLAPSPFISPDSLIQSDLIEGFTLLLFSLDRLFYLSRMQRTDQFYDETLCETEKK
jgi:hypothetical protein